MRRYSAFASATNTVSTTVPMFCITGATTTRVRVYDLVIGSSATPADNSAEFSIVRTSARGTQSTSFTPNPLDPADPASSVTFDTAWSVDPTISASSNLLTISMNQRATVRWVAAPDSEFIIPATSGAGLALTSVVASMAAIYSYNTLWQE